MDQFPFIQISQWLASGKIIPFVGAGASRATGVPGRACLPDGRGLADELITAMGGAFPAEPVNDLAKVAQYVQHTAFDREFLYEFLHRRFEEEQQDEAPGTVAQLLAGMPRGDHPLFVVTTNYDSHIEKAFRAAGRPLCIITQNMRDPRGGASRINLTMPDGTQTQDNSIEFQWNDRRFPDDCAYLFKMHGSVHRKTVDGPDDVIITEDDYVDFMVSAGVGSVSPFFPPPSLTSAYKQRRFLFLGYSLYDWNFRAFLRMLSIRNALSGREAKRHWAIQLHPKEIEVDLWKHRNVNVYDGDLGDFCERMTSAWASVQREEDVR